MSPILLRSALEELARYAAVMDDHRADAVGAGSVWIRTEFDLDQAPGSLNDRVQDYVRTETLQELVRQAAKASVMQAYPRAELRAVVGEYLSRAGIEADRELDERRDPDSGGEEVDLVRAEDPAQRQRILECWRRDQQPQIRLIVERRALRDAAAEKLGVNDSTELWALTEARSPGETVTEFEQVAIEPLDAEIARATHRRAHRFGSDVGQAAILHRWPEETSCSANDLLGDLRRLGTAVW